MVVLKFTLAERIQSLPLPQDIATEFQMCFHNNHNYQNCLSSVIKEAMHGFPKRIDSREKKTDLSKRSIVLEIKIRERI
jgi:hypothetical protein